jgi:hypothetical protein
MRKQDIAILLNTKTHRKPQKKAAETINNRF